MASTCASSDTSTVTAVAAPPAATISVVTDSALSGTTSATTTLAPSVAKRIAATRPMPLPAPVITATLPSSRPIDASVAFGECVRPAPYWDIAESGILVHAVYGAGPSHRSHHVPPGCLVGCLGARCGSGPRCLCRPGGAGREPLVARLERRNEDGLS